MGMSWTKEQEQVITLRNRNILVSAAAGSGKTAVLVERIIQKILDQKNPVDIDRILIVTFTNAAAAEMRERISAAIEQALEDQPENLHLQRQATLVHNAQITTIHSFCLYTIRTYFHKIDLEPNFRIAEEGELQLIKSDVLDEVLNEKYEGEEEAFLQMVETFATGKNDDALRNMVLQLYHFAMSYPWPKEYLQNVAENYRYETEEQFFASPWLKELEVYVKKILTDCEKTAKKSRNLTLESDGPAYLNGLMEQELEAIQSLLQVEDFEKLSQSIRLFEFARMPSKRGFDGDADKLEIVKNNRDKIKSTIKKLKEDYFYTDFDIARKDINLMYPVVKSLAELTGDFMEAFAAKKREKNILDFDDLEHFALKILIDEETKKVTEAAEDFKDLFEEIMVDEYQDSNFVQETLLTAISKLDRGIYNQFMVGDVKQSIYRFRLARPELFMDKYEAYTSEESETQRIDLHKNFRSREEVLKFSNDIFYKIMMKDLGNVIYDDDAALYPGAAYPESDSMKAEILLADAEDELLEEAGIGDKIQLEAKMTAYRIKDLIKSQKVTDKKTGELRPAQYSDIVILLRSFSGYADAFTKCFEEEGIPAHATSKSGYFETIEIQTILSLLQVIDNPRQDIPMAAVLRSPIVGCSDEELAILRGTDTKSKYYQCILQARERELPEDLERKLQLFFELLTYFRKKVCDTPIHDLLRELLQKTGYLEYVTAMPGGMRKKANVDMLMEKAIAYESTSYKGLFHFVRYIDQLRKYEVDYGEADIVSENENAVRIMTIHKSKGLEFPIVFVCGLGKKFNKMDTRSRMVIHPELGIGVDCIDYKRRVKKTTVIKKAIAKKIDLENTGEELRVLYVAFTRAKEKLILTGTVKNPEEYLGALRTSLEGEEELSYLMRTEAACYMDWVIPAALLYHGRYSIDLWNVGKMIAEETREQVEKTQGIDAMIAQAGRLTPEEIQDLAKRLECKYPFETDKNQKTKYSVSELKHRAMDQMTEEEEYETPKKFVEEPQTESAEYIPAFMNGLAETVNEGALRGTAMHRAMECLPIEKLTVSETLYEDLKREIAKEVENGRLTEEMANLLGKKKLMDFYKNPLAKRMAKAKLQGNLFMEKPFVMGKDACEIDDDTDSKEMILIQGIIDAYFIEDNEIVLLDYKTDRVEREEQLVERYQRQLDLYQDALEQALGKKVKEKLIYSFYFGKVIAL